MGGNDFTKIPNGIPSLQDRINVLYTYGVKAGKIDLHTFVNCASTQVAKTFDLFPRKGTIQPDADADLVVSGRGGLSRANFPPRRNLSTWITTCLKAGKLKAGQASSPCAEKSRCVMGNLLGKLGAENF